MIMILAVVQFLFYRYSKSMLHKMAELHFPAYLCEDKNPQNLGMSQCVYWVHIRLESVYFSVYVSVCLYKDLSVTIYLRLGLPFE